MRCSGRSLGVAAAALLGLALPPVQARVVAMPLCGGGVMMIPLGGKPGDSSGACHVACATRRSDDEAERGAEP